MAKNNNLIRVFLYDENGCAIKYNREDGYETPIDYAGYEDLDLKEDVAKIFLYQNAEYIELFNNKVYKVEKRVFMPCIPICLYLFLAEE